MDSCIKLCSFRVLKRLHLLLSEILKHRHNTRQLQISHDKKSRDKNVTDYNVADSVRRDIKVIVTKTRCTVCVYYC